MIGHNFNDAQNCRLVEITDETFGLLRNGQVIAPRKHVRNAVLVLSKAVEPKIFAETHLGDQLSICWEMIIEVLRLQVF